VLVAALMLGGIVAVLLGETPGSITNSAPHVSRPMAPVATPPERFTPAVYPTRGEYVPPIPTATPTTAPTTGPSTAPTTHKPHPKTTKPPTTQPRPACPFQLPSFHKWCVQNGFQPPKG
jgi:hypothetical protein